MKKVWQNTILASVLIITSFLPMSPAQAATLSLIKPADNSSTKGVVDFLFGDPVNSNQEISHICIFLDGSVMLESQLEWVSMPLSEDKVNDWLESPDGSLHDEAYSNEADGCYGAYWNKTLRPYLNIVFDTRKLTDGLHTWHFIFFDKANKPWEQNFTFNTANNSAGKLTWDESIDGATYGSLATLAGSFNNPTSKLPKKISLRYRKYLGAWSAWKDIPLNEGSFNAGSIKPTSNMNIEVRAIINGKINIYKHNLTIALAIKTRIPKKVAVGRNVIVNITLGAPVTGRCQIEFTFYPTSGRTNKMVTTKIANIVAGKSTASITYRETGNIDGFIKCHPSQLLEITDSFGAEIVL